MAKEIPQPLAEGVYGSKREPALQLTRYLGARETKNPGEYQHTFVVNALNGTAGSAFLRFGLPKYATLPGAVALAFNKLDMASEAEQAKAKELLMGEAARKVVAANTPDEQQESAIEKMYANILTQIRISVGIIYRLQDWDQAERDANGSLEDLEACQFAGHVNHRTYEGKLSAEVDSVSPCRMYDKVRAVAASEE